MKHRSCFVRFVLAAVVAIGGMVGAAHADPTTIAGTQVQFLRMRQCAVAEE